MALEAMKLANVKLYMRVDGNEEDVTIESLYAAAVSYLQNAGIKEPTQEDELYTLAVHGLCLHWYTNRGDEQSDMPMGLRTIINQLKFTQF